MSHNHIDDHFCQTWYIERNFDWLVMYHFHEPVNNDQYQVVAVTFPVGWDWKVVIKFIDRSSTDE